MIDLVAAQKGWRYSKDGKKWRTRPPKFIGGVLYFFAGMWRRSRTYKRKTLAPK